MDTDSTVGGLPPESHERLPPEPREPVTVGVTDGITSALVSVPLPVLFKRIIGTAAIHIAFTIIWPLLLLESLLVYPFTGKFKISAVCWLGVVLGVLAGHQLIRLLHLHELLNWQLLAVMYTVFGAMFVETEQSKYPLISFAALTCGIWVALLASFLGIY